MNHPTWIKAAAFSLATMLASTPASATCTQGTCFTPPGCACLDQIADTNFDALCSDWAADGEAYLLNSGSDYYWELEGTSSGETSAYIEQTVTVPSTKTSIAVHVDVDVINASPGSEGLWIDIRSTGGTLLENVEVVRPNDGSDYYIANTSGYGGQTIVLRIRYRPGLSPLGTVYRIKEVHFITC